MKWGIMEIIEAVKTAAAAAGVPITHIGPAMGKRENYVSVVANKRCDPSTTTAAAMLEACGYALAAVPFDDLPASALVIDSAPGDL